MKIRTMRGVTLDLAQILAQNETTVAVGNANMNARGDIVGPGGQIVKRKEQVAQEYHRNPNSVKRVSLKDVQPDTFLSPQEVMEQAAAQQQKPPRTRKIVDRDD